MGDGRGNGLFLAVWKQVLCQMGGNEASIRSGAAGHVVCCIGCWNCSLKRQDEHFKQTMEWMTENIFLEHNCFPPPIMS